WVKDGPPGNHRMSRAHHVPMDRLVEALVPYAKKYHDTPPTFSGDGGKPTAGGYRYVVVKVPDEEVNSTVPDEGYYHVRELEPEECRRLLNLPGES
ncbi:MAG TPA: hypothetical protein VFP36_07450, partial [Usitatibacter sp.]|nr:hypothetical protein [Usitatibacter sp.]